VCVCVCVNFQMTMCSAVQCAIYYEQYDISVELISLTVIIIGNLFC
jgi:hypothetical protein